MLGSCDTVDRSSRLSNAPEELTREAERAAQWVRASRRGDPLTDSQILGVGYLEQARLGLSSPFRLAEFALADPRIESPDRAAVASAILLMAANGRAYEIDSRVLDAARPLAGPEGADPGAPHLRLIDRTIREADDPRAGELAVRIAYSLATAEGLIRRTTSRTAIRVAALLRDRELARRDVADLVATARNGGRPVLAALSEWRAAGRPSVERPLSTPLGAAREEQALQLAELAVEAVRNLAAPTGTPAAPSQPPPRSMLGLRTAARLAVLVANDPMPARPPVSVAIEAHRAILDSDAPFGPRGRAAAARFLRRASTPESLAPEVTLLNARATGHPVANSVALWAAVGMRPFAQERPWFPGSPAPTATDIADYHGIAEVTFDRSIPDPWKPFHLAVLDGALRDLAQVIPTLSLRGLRVHVGQNADRPGPLALHNPGERRLYLPPATAAGTLAHEIAHDLDWQVALRRYRVRGDYGTDRALREGGFDALASRVRGLAGAEAAVGGGTVDHWTRPAEVFARGVDWFTTVSLGAHGRMNGYLSSVQDDVLTGYGTVSTPDPSGTSGAALIAILDEIAPPYPAVREAYLAAYGPTRAYTAMDLLRLALGESDRERAERGGGSAGEPARDPSARGTGPRRLEVALRGYDPAARALASWLCRSPGGAYGAVEANARLALIADAVRASARGLAQERARAIAGPAGTRWLARRIYGGRWREEPVPAEAREELEDLLAELEAVEARVPALPPGGALQLRSAPDACGGGGLF